MPAKTFFIITIVLNIFLFLPLESQAAFLNVVINEIAWMGTENSPNDEWIELYNNTDNAINLDGWVLKAADGTPEINLAGTVLARSFYLSERTDDNTVPEVSADLIYKGALGNKGEDLKLYDNLGNLIDEVNCSSGWLAGDNLTKQTMERIDTNWQTSQNPGGTPKSVNPKSESPVEESPLPIPESTENGPPSTEEEKVETRSLPTYPTGIIFSEILPSPEGPDDKEEWIELLNQNDFEVDVSGWKIKDKEGKTTEYTLSTRTKIGASGYLILLRPETKIVLNNDKDSLELLAPDGKIIDSVIFEKAPLGESYNKTESGEWFWSNNLTPGAKNIVISSQPSTQKSSEKKSEAGPLKTESIAKETAALDKKIPKSFDYLPSGQYLGSRVFTFLIAFGVAIFSAIIILILKKIVSKSLPNSSRTNQFP